MKMNSFVYENKRVSKQLKNTTYCMMASINHNI